MDDDEELSVAELDEVSSLDDVALLVDDAVLFDVDDDEVLDDED